MKEFNPSVKACFSCESSTGVVKSLCTHCCKESCEPVNQEKDDIIVQVVIISRTSQMSHIGTLVSRCQDLGWC